MSVASVSTSSLAPHRRRVRAGETEKGGLPALVERAKAALLRRWLEIPLVLGIALALVYDRYVLCKQYLFSYTDVDQVTMWYAAHELLNGRVHEPCFFGQDYNSCLEGYLAVPLIAMRVPYHVAVPLVTVMLGLLPFVWLAWVAWKRGHPMVAATALFMPLVLPVRYGLITGMPRGFVTGVAIAAIPAILLLPPAPRPRIRTADGQERAGDAWRPSRWLARPWPAWRYFLSGALALLAIQINPNCLVLLVPVAVYAIITSWREWKFWVYGLAGMAAVAPYLLYVYQFYHVYHPDYVAYLRGVQYSWGFNVFNSFLKSSVAPQLGNSGSDAASQVLMDLVPYSVGAVQAPLFMAGAFGLLALLLLIRGRAAGLAATMAGVAFTLISFGYARVQTTGNNTASFPWGRMYLALPVLLVWLLFLVNHAPWPRFAQTMPVRWLVRGVLAAMLVFSWHAYAVKKAELPGVLSTEVRRAQTCAPVAVDELYAIAREVQKAAEQNDADLLVVGGNDKQLAYALPALADIETLFINQTAFERRTWRFIEETTTKRHNVLFMYYNVGGTQVGGNITILVDANGEPLEDEDGNPVLANPSGAGARGGGGAMMGGGMGGAGGQGMTGGRGAAGGGTTGAGAGRAAGGRGGMAGGRGFGRGRAPDPAALAKPHPVTIPAITLLDLGGQTLFQVARVRSELPVIDPPNSARNPLPWPTVERPDWRGR